MPDSSVFKTIRIIGGRSLQTVGCLGLVLAALFLGFACSPANTADAPALLEGGGRVGGIAAIILVVGTALVSKKSRQARKTMTSRQLSEAVNAALRAYLDESGVPSAHPSPAIELDRLEREVAKRFGAVPVLRDMLETFFLRCDGTFFGWDNDTPGDPSVIREHATESSKTMLMGWGARRHPALRVLLPVRPASASDCTVCNGAGAIATSNTAPAPCSACSGLGWREELA